MFTPAAMAASAAANSFSSELSRFLVEQASCLSPCWASCRSLSGKMPDPLSALNKIGSVAALEARAVDLPEFSNSSFVRIGCFSLMSAQLSGREFSKPPREPTIVSVEVMISSRIGSIGGFVTCANNCLK